MWTSSADRRAVMEDSVQPVWLQLLETHEDDPKSSSVLIYTICVVKCVRK